MPYSLPLVILQNLGAGLTKSGGTTGFPSGTFRYLLLSEWICLGTSSRAVGVDNVVTFMALDCNNSSVRVRLLAGVSTPVFDGTYATPINNILSNILVSVDLLEQQIQVYRNDASLTLTSGGWTGSGQFLISPGFNGWDIGGAGSVAPGPGIADLYIAAPNAPYDLSVTANRRQFINADLSPVDLGTNATSVLGVAPAIWLTARSGVANDFAVNGGTGGAFTIVAPPLVFQAPGTCEVLYGDGGGGDTRHMLSDADLFFTTTAHFVDLSNSETRKKFIAGSMTPAFLGARGELPLNTRPAVFLTTAGGQDPTAFAQNVGVGGAFAITDGITMGPPGLGCAFYIERLDTGSASHPQWRLSVSDDGGRTWGILMKGRDAGELGQYRRRLRWLKMGQFRQRLVKLECSDSVRRNIIGVYQDIMQGLN